MAARKYTPKEMAQAKILRNKRNRERSFIKRQEHLASLLGVDGHRIRKCDCGKLFDEVIYSGSGSFAGGIRDRCVKCPLKKYKRKRKVFSKLKQRFVFQYTWRK